jgi:hypothetical protein
MGVVVGEGAEGVESKAVMTSGCYISWVVIP